ncbi:MAG TPA: thiamine phosphate synthase [Bacteroidia bacterium]|nr:thiamine phosphate synthase [Bacteroidia bacterium]
MKLILISPSDTILNEKEIAISLFEKGLGSFQVYKPSLSKEEIQNYIHSFPKKYLDRIELHAQFPKFHSLKELNNHIESSLLTRKAYFFLSPIFNSISKQGYHSKFNLQELSIFLKKYNSSLLRKDLGEAIALGGIDEDKIEVVRELGFTGVAVLGAVWESNDPIEKFVRLKTLCQKKDHAY